MDSRLAEVDGRSPLGRLDSPVIPKGAVFGRPKPMQCPNQYDEHSTVPNVETCDYVLMVDRPITYESQNRVGWRIVDRPVIEAKDAHDPWYIGPEITFAQEQVMFTSPRSASERPLLRLKRPNASGQVAWSLREPRRQLQLFALQLIDVRQYLGDGCVRFSRHGLADVDFFVEQLC